MFLDPLYQHSSTRRHTYCAAGRTSSSSSQVNKIMFSSILLFMNLRFSTHIDVFIPFTTSMKISPIEALILYFPSPTQFLPFSVSFFFLSVFRSRSYRRSSLHTRTWSQCNRFFITICHVFPFQRFRFMSLSAIVGTERAAEYENECISCLIIANNLIRIVDTTANTNLWHCLWRRECKRVP